jgi:uncharacterized protein (DUF1697 family)
LRGINVGGNAIVSMAAVREALVTHGMSDVRTYINSGNVIFSTAAPQSPELTAGIERALEERTGMAIRALITSREALKELVDAIPPHWADDKTMRTYVLLLWSEIDDSTILDRIPVRPGVDEVRYVGGAVIWRVDREKVGYSGMSKLVGTPLYRQITVRSVNTIRKLSELTTTSTRRPDGA